MSMIICDNCGIHADSDYGNCVFGDVHSFCSEECCEKFKEDKQHVENILPRNA